MTLRITAHRASQMTLATCIDELLALYTVSLACCHLRLEISDSIRLRCIDLGVMSSSTLEDPMLLTWNCFCCSVLIVIFMISAHGQDERQAAGGWKADDAVVGSNVQFTPAVRVDACTKRSPNSAKSGSPAHPLDQVSDRILTTILVMLEPGDDYVRKIAAFIRNNEQRLAEAGFGRRRKTNSLPPGSLYNPLAWFGLADSNTPRPPVVLSLDTHHLFYLLIRLEALGFSVGSVDVRLQNLSRPLNYVHFDDKSETLSIADSFRSSISVMSKLSLGGGWWGRPEPPKTDMELKYIYSSFTKLPALSIRAPGPNGIEELADDPPDDNAVPVYVFKNLQSLECQDIDPRALLGWDRLAESLRSLTIKRSGIENPTCIFVDSVLEDQRRREEGSNQTHMRRFGSLASFTSDTSVPATVQEEAEDSDSADDERPNLHPADKKLSPLKWAFLKHLSLSENALPGVPSDLFQNLTSLTSLDLSSNLLVSIPAGLSSLYNLLHLNLSDNMIDSVLGIYTKLGSILSINLSGNRLDSLCGLERLMALERVDLRNNRVEESAEVGRLAVLPNISAVWVDENPFMHREENPRAKCFDLFHKEGKTIQLDGSLPTYYERRVFTAPLEQMGPPRPRSAQLSPPIVAQDHVSQPPPDTPVAGPSFSPSVSTPGSPASALGPAARRNRRKKKRIVDLDDGESGSQDGALSSGPHSRVASVGPRSMSKSPNRTDRAARATSLVPVPITSTNGAQSKAVETMSRNARHSRFMSETGPSPIEELPSSSTFPEFRATDIERLGGNKRRERQAASVYEAARLADRTSHIVSVSSSDAEAFRARIEALRSEVGDSWLHVFSQSQIGASSPRSPPKPSIKG